jgi:MAX-like protein X
MLQKGAEYIKQLRMERAALSEQMESLRKEIETLTNSLKYALTYFEIKFNLTNYLINFYSHLQSALPANGATNVSRQRNGRMKEMYQEFVMQRTMQNWKYWIVS